MRVKIPFLPRFEGVMLSGMKTCTSRTKKYGKLGDTFEAFDATFVIERVFKEELSNIAWFRCDEEGFQTPTDFIKCWEKIHYRKGYDPSQEVWVHQFRRLQSD